MGYAAPKAFCASELFGWLWQTFGAPVAFLVGAGLALVATVGVSRLEGPL